MTTVFLVASEHDTVLEAEFLGKVPQPRNAVAVTGNQIDHINTALNDFR